MVSSNNGENSGEDKESNGTEVKSNVPLHVSTSQRGLISGENSGNGFSDGFSALSKRLRFLKFGNLSSQSAKFLRIAEDRDEVSRNVPSSTSLHIRERFNRIFSRKIDWNSLGKICKEWIRDPMNLALFIWITCVAVSGAILFMVMIGMLNHAIPKKSQRDTWFEVNNQILNALFTLMCLYQHPKRIYHLSLLLRWRPEDVLKLRRVYCENGTYKPHEWAHMMVVVALLNINCFAQYALCGLNLGYKRSERPAIGVGICISVAIGAPAIAGIYSTLSPLGKDYETELDEEAQLPVTADGTSRPDPCRRQSFEKRFSFALRDEERNVESRPLWSGGILDIWDDISLAYLSLFCSFCVFGWNMERLGFGNMYVHIVTFLLFCMAPFWIFNLAAVNIDNDTVRAVLGVTGIFLCVFGLLYGGFWRIQMRKRFNLPPYNFCFGKPALGDFVLWLFCCWCSLAQEVRTGNSYDIVEDKFCRRKRDQLPMSPLPREDGEFLFRSSPSSPLGYSSSPLHIMKANSPSPSRISKDYYSPERRLSLIEEESHIQGKDEMMTPPTHSVIRREEI
ncbi:PLAC8 family protein [Abeliophyllum distichum]|uniref:PLAC8 family protein n=1 Tax=Abeliophyllum distichum TaxID=126358 RepID=A0ABD1UQ86_9LAMI